MHISTVLGRLRGRPLVIIAGLVVLGAATINAEPGLAGGPQKLLQSVTVGMSTDGAITSVDLANIARTGGALKSQSFDLDPSKVASGLPVTVAVSYLKDGKPGTDLSQLAGAKGLVEVDVTVTNRTLRPREIHYQSGGVDHSAWALVGTPMTVVASATLPKDSFASVVQTPAGVPTAHTTNGVVSMPAGSDGSVQWAAMLAPPRLSGSTTFRLVEDATKFSMPNFSLSVRPGLLTDPSVTSVLDDAYGSSGSLASIENTTIGLISNVTASMAEATDSLQAIRDDLRSNAQAVGSAATRTLRQTGQDLQATAASLTNDLSSLRDSLSGSLSTASDASAQALRTSLQALIDEFGLTPGAGDPVPAPSGAATCGVITPGDGGPATLMGQLRAVAGQVKSLSTSSGACVASLQQSLDATIGTSGQPCPATGQQTLVCQLTSAGVKLDSVATDLATQGSTILGEVQAGTTGDVKARLALLTAQVGKLYDDATALHATNGALDGVLGGLTASTLSDLKKALSDATSSAKTLATDLTDVHDTASAQIGTLGATDTTGLRKQVADLSTQLCAMPQLPADLSSATDPDAVTALQTWAASEGRSCTTAGSLATALGATVTAWQSVVASTGGSSGAAADLSTLTGHLQQASGDVGDALAALAGGDDGRLSTALGQLTADLQPLYDPTDSSSQAADPCQVASSPGGAKMLNAVQRSLAALDCNRLTVTDQLTSLLAAHHQFAQDAAKDVEDAAAHSNSARAAADDQLGTLLGTLVSQLDGTADQQVRTGAAVLGQQESALQDEQTKALTDLDASTKQALAALAEGVSASSGQQDAATRLLQSELAKVLTDLGSAANGTGLLGDIQAKAGETDVRATQVATAADTATGYRGVRTADLNAQILAQEQFSQAMRQVQSFPAFATRLPAKSTSTTVFVYRLPKI